MRKNSQREVYLVKNLYKVLRFRWAERRRAIERLFSSQCCGNDEGDKLCVDPKLREVLGSNGRRVFCLLAAVARDSSKNWGVLCGTWIADILILEPAGGLWSQRVFKLHSMLSQ